MEVFLNVYQESVCFVGNHATEGLKLLWRTFFRQAKTTDQLHRNVGYVEIQCRVSRVVCHASALTHTFPAQIGQAMHRLLSHKT